MSVNKDTLKQIIYERHDIIKNMDIMPRKYDLEENGNYVVTGLRRAGKTTVLYMRVQDLIKKGVSYDQIIYINFEDERLTEFNINDFNEILEVKAEICDKKPYYFFDEIQNITGWEKFARRMADSNERVYITGSNAKMLSKEIESALGGRYFSKYITTYNFKEYLQANNVSFEEKDLYKSESIGKIKKYFNEYFRFGGFPEAVKYVHKREYVSGIYQKILLNDIIARNDIRNENALKVLVKKISETVCQPVSYTKLHNIVQSVGFKVSKDTLIDYMGHIKDAYLLYDVQNYYAKFVEKESNPKYYFRDNGLLNLFLQDKDSALLENVVGLHLLNNNEEVYYLKSNKNDIDIDFYLPEKNVAVQVAYSLDITNEERETDSLINFAKENKQSRLIIVTYDTEETIEKNGITIEVIPAYKFLLRF